MNWFGWKCLVCRQMNSRSQLIGAKISEMIMEAEGIPWMSEVKGNN